MFLELEWPRDSPTSPVDRERIAARHAVTAILALSRDLFLPLEFGVLRCMTRDVDGAWLTSTPDEGDYWYLNTPDREPQPAYVNPVVFDVATIDEQTMMRMVDDLLTEPHERSTHRWPGWSEIHIYDTLARLPDSLVPTGDEFIVDDVDNKCRDLRIPVRRRSGGAWVGSPGLGFWTPISVLVQRDSGVSGTSFGYCHYATISLSIDINWSVWWREDSLGRAVLDAGMHRLYRLGWASEPGEADP